MQGNFISKINLDQQIHHFMVGIYYAKILRQDVGVLVDLKQYLCHYCNAIHIKSDIYFENSQHNDHNAQQG